MVSERFSALGSILTRTLSGDGASACAGVTVIVIRSPPQTGSATATHNPQSQILMLTPSPASKATATPYPGWRSIEGNAMRGAPDQELMIDTCAEMIRVACAADRHWWGRRRARPRQHVVIPSATSIRGEREARHMP